MLLTSKLAQMYASFTVGLAPGMTKSKVGEEEEGSPALANPATSTTSPTANPIFLGYSRSFLTWEIWKCQTKLATKSQEDNKDRIPSKNNQQTRNVCIFAT